MPGFIKPYLETTLIILILSIPSLLNSQVVVLDTTMELSYPLTETEQLDLNNYLMLASSEGLVAAIRWLMEYGAEIDCKTYENVTPLMFAVANNKTEAVKALLRYNPDINVKTLYSETPLLASVKNGNMDITEILLRDSADINLADKYGATPLHYASVYGYFYIADMLLYYGAINSIKSNDGTTPLMGAVWSGYADIADLLIQNGANFRDKDNLGFTPFLIAAQNGDTVIMEMLLNMGVNMYEVNNFNYDALDLCIKTNQKYSVEYLFRKGYKWELKSPSTVSPYVVATKYSRTEIIRILKDKQVPDKRSFGFDQAAISASVRFCTHDYFTGFNLAFKEPLLNGGIIAGVDFKPGYTRVLVKADENLYYQYKDKSSMGYFGLFKNISLTNNFFGGNWSISTSVVASYSFGNKFKGTDIAPENKFKLVPAAGLKFELTNFSVYGNIEYMKTDFFKVGPIWFRAGAAINIFFDDKRGPGKIIKWY
jgi:ankyrin repeat protein